MKNHFAVPFFSIVIPLYNQEAYIGECVRSVLGQTFADYEVIVVNDGSTDGSVAVVETLLDDARLRVISQKNAGVSAARNAGIAAAAGDFIAFLDADDFWCANYLQAVFHALQTHPNTQIVACRYTENRDLLHCNETDFVVLPVENYYRIALRNTLLSSSSVVIETEHLRCCGGFDTDLRMGEDTEMWFRVNHSSPGLLYLKNNLVFYRTNQMEKAAGLHPLHTTAMAHFSEKFTDWQRNRDAALAVAFHNYDNLIPYYFEQSAQTQLLLDKSPVKVFPISMAYKVSPVLYNIFPNKLWHQTFIRYTIKLLARWYSRGLDEKIFQ